MGNAEQIHVYGTN